MLELHINAHRTLLPYWKNALKDFKAYLWFLDSPGVEWEAELSAIRPL